ncbi:MAG: low temperature requirement protein A [Pseudonocardia sp.]|nr:low temperature requirement protein A [Pseudonocardia sp.]
MAPQHDRAGPGGGAPGVDARHPEHIAERYGLFTIIVLGECVLATTVAFQAGMTAEGLSPDLVLLGVGGLMVMFGMWWTYFLGGDEHGLTSLRVAMTWGYGRYLVFAVIAALGAGLEVAVQVSLHVAHVDALVAGLAVSVPVAVFLVAISQLRRTTWPKGLLSHGLVLGAAVLILLCAGLAPLLGIGAAVLVMGVVLAIMLGLFLRARHEEAADA